VAVGSVPTALQDPQGGQRRKRLRRPGMREDERRSQNGPTRGRRANGPILRLSLRCDSHFVLNGLAAFWNILAASEQRRSRAKLLRRDTHDPLEVSREMALIRETDGARHFRQRALS
jgi:hypothetical protein